MGAIHDVSFELVKKQLSAATKMAHSKEAYYIFLFTDTSYHHWEVILSEVTYKKWIRKVEDQEQKPLCFI